MIETTHPALSVRGQCRLLGLARATYLRVVAQGHEASVDKDAPLREKIDRIYTDHPYFGARRITRELWDRHGLRVNRKKVRRLMRKMRIESVLPGPNTSKPHPSHPVYPYLLRGLSIERPNQVWSTDITYIPTTHGYCYLVAVMDWYSRKVLSHRLSNTMDASFCVEALEEAVRLYGPPEIFNSDPGAQFTSVQFTDGVKASGAGQSMDGKGGAIDNVFVERLWWS